MTSANPSSSPISSGKVLRILAGVQNTSALVFTTFLTVHLASPILAVVGGGETATNVMLLGRAYYHPLEPVLVYGSAITHISASIIRRLYLLYKTKRLPQPTFHLISGYLLIPFFLLHLYTHRILPSNPNPLINSLSPSELDYSFVSFGLQKWPVVSWVAYTGLVVNGVWHSLSGLMKVAAWTGRKRTRGIVLPSRSGTTANGKDKTGFHIGLRGVAIGITGLILLGTARLHSESVVLGARTRERMDAVYRSVGFLYR